MICIDAPPDKPRTAGVVVAVPHHVTVVEDAVLERDRAPIKAAEPAAIASGSAKRVVGHAIEHGDPSHRDAQRI